jgi:hypothetical protein
VYVNLEELTTPFLLKLFSLHGIPDVHMDTNARDRIVFAYVQSCGDQMAVTDGHIPGDPRSIKWKYSCLLMTNTVKWNIRSSQVMLSHMDRDETERAYVVLPIQLKGSCLST